MFSTSYSLIFTKTRVVECLTDRLLRLAVIAPVDLDFFVDHLYGVYFTDNTGRQVVMTSKLYQTKGQLMPDVTTYLSLLAGSGCIEEQQLVSDCLL